MVSHTANMQHTGKLGHFWKKKIRKFEKVPPSKKYHLLHYIQFLTTSFVKLVKYKLGVVFKSNYKCILYSLLSKFLEKHYRNRGNYFSISEKMFKTR